MKKKVKVESMKKKVKVESMKKLVDKKIRELLDISPVQMKSLTSFERVHCAQTLISIRRETK